MSITDDLDADALISRLAGPLSPPARAAFRAAAEDALTRVPCWGEGAVYRAVAGLQRAFFDPPSDGRALWDIQQELVHVSKLRDGPPIEYDDLRRVRYRKHAHAQWGRAMYWVCAQVEPRRERLASHCLGLAGYEIYQPLLREQRRSHGRKIVVTPPLFPGY